MGVATPLDFNSAKVDFGKGRVFCYLPLPPESDVRTGFNVHIQASFGLTDNRRNLKWPGPECQNDDSAEWNILLLNDMISKAYSNHVYNLTQLKYSSKDIVQIVNSIIPNMDIVQGHWRNVLEPLFRDLSDKAVFWSNSCGGRWISLKEAVIDRLADPSANIPLDVSDVVLKVLKEAGEPVITPPVHAMKAIDKYVFPIYSTIQEITPSYVRKVLKRETTDSRKGFPTNQLEYSPRSHHLGSQRWTATRKLLSQTSSVTQNDQNNDGLQGQASFIWHSLLDTSEKLLLLKFIVKDEDFADLKGIPLLPLADKTFAKFHPNRYSTDPNSAIFIASRNNPQALFYGGLERFLDETIDSDLYECLRKVALDPDNHNKSSISPTQLVILTVSLVPGLLSESLPHDWKNPNLAQVLFF